MREAGRARMGFTMKDRGAHCIHLIRHGRPACSRSGFLTADAFRSWLSAYDAAGVEATPPNPVIALARSDQDRALICSTLPRAITSARQLDADTDWRPMALFDEAPVIVPRWPLRLPVPVWLVVARLVWLISPRCADSRQECRKRAHAAARMLIMIVADKPVIVVGHGWMHRMIAAELRRCGLKIQGRTGAGFWGSTSLCL